MTRWWHYSSAILSVCVALLCRLQSGETVEDVFWLEYGLQLSVDPRSRDRSGCVC